MKSDLIKCLIAIASFFLSIHLSAQTIRINETNYATIAEAHEAAESGDTIFVSGILTEVVSISKSITLMGSDPKSDIIQAAQSLDESSARVISMGRAADATEGIDVTIENLGIRYGKSGENGGGVYADKLGGKVTLKHLIIEQNSTDKNGGGVSVAGSSAEIVDCTIAKNNSSLDGGGIILAPNNAAAIDNEITIKNSVIDSNIGRNGGGIYINGNKDYGDNQKIDVTLINTFVSNNSAFSASSGNGGGAIWSKSVVWKGDNTSGNASLTLIHTTIYNNSHNATLKSGIQFTTTSTGAETKFSAYNSIIVAADDVAQKALNFAKSNTQEVINCILGGLNAADTTLIDAADKNNVKGKTASFAGLKNEFTDEGGNIDVLALVDTANAINYCTASVDITLPDFDARGVERDDMPDAGAFEYFDSNNAPTLVGEISDMELQTGFVSEVIDLTGIFSDPDGDELTLSVMVENENVITAAILNNDLTITEVGTGTTNITVRASDFKGAYAEVVFSVKIGTNNAPEVAYELDDISLNNGFGSKSIFIGDLFSDIDGDALSLSFEVSDTDVVSASMDQDSLVMMEKGLGSAVVELIADDGKGGRNSTSFMITVSTLLRSNNSEREFQVYPNPTFDYLHLKHHDLNEIHAATLIDINGKKQQLTLNQSGDVVIADLRGISKGQYFLIIQTNQKQTVIRILKK